MLSARKDYRRGLWDELVMLRKCGPVPQCAGKPPSLSSLELLYRFMSRWRLTAYIVETLAMIDRGMRRTITLNEAAVRCRLNIILSSALDLVMQGPMEGRWPLTLHTETPLDSRFFLDGKRHQTHDKMRFPS